LTFLGFDFQHRGAGQTPDQALIIIVNIVQVHFVPAGKTVDFHILPLLISLGIGLVSYFESTFILGRRTLRPIGRITASTAGGRYAHGLQEFGLFSLDFPETRIYILHTVQGAFLFLAPPGFLHLQGSDSKKSLVRLGYLVAGCRARTDVCQASKGSFG
jgi:hypothetical protein